MNRTILKYTLFILTVATAAQCEKEDPHSPPAVLDDAPWATTLPQLKPVPGVGGVKASDCAQCHQEIYNEWKLSTHAHALSDLQFQSELSKDSSPKWLCLNCHIPVANQREFLTVSLKDGDIYKPVQVQNPGFDPEMREEAVTCATCHIIQNDKGESVIVGANGNLNAPHPVVKDPEYVNNRCYDCHNQTAVLTDSLVCSFQTGDELNESGLQGQSCASCHMPQLKRSFVIDSMQRPVRNSHSHRFIGGGVPKEFSLIDDQVVTDDRKVHPGDGIKNSRDGNHTGYRPGLGVRLIEISKDQSNIKITLELRNLAAGHYVPTGDPERFVMVYAELLDPAGRVIETKSYRIGQIWKWDPKAEKVSDNRLKHNEVRSHQMSFNSTKGFRMIRIKAEHVRLTEKNAKYKEYTYKKVPEPYRQKVKSIRQHYPMKILFHESLYSRDGTLIKEIPLKDLFEKQARK